MAEAAGEKLSDQVRRAVVASGRTQADLGQAAGISEAMMSRFVAGKVALSMAKLDRLAAVLGLSVTGEVKKQQKPA